MKTTKQTKLLSVAATICGLAAFTFSPVAYTQDDDVDKIKIKGEDGGKVKIKDDKIKVKGDADAELDAAREVLSAEEQAEFKAALVEGYTIPQERYVYLDPVPETYITRLDPVPDGMVYRYYDGTVYTVNPETYTVVSVHTFD